MNHRMMYIVGSNYDDSGYKVRYDVDDSGSMDVKELGRLLFTLLDNGQRVSTEQREPSIPSCLIFIFDTSLTSLIGRDRNSGG